jgi:hypothetical protein
VQLGIQKSKFRTPDLGLFLFFEFCAVFAYIPGAYDELPDLGQCVQSGK